MVTVEYRSRSGVWGAGTTPGGVADVATGGCDKADGVGYRRATPLAKLGIGGKLTMPVL